MTSAREIPAAEHYAAEETAARSRIDAGRQRLEAFKRSELEEAEATALARIRRDTEQTLARQAEALDRATRLGLRLDSVQFKGAPLKALPQVWRQQITLPLQGRHADLMAWLNHAWAQADWSVDALDLTRDDVMSDQVKARVTLSIWARTEAPTQALASLPHGGPP